ncbi:MAG: restriction endonuclease subunit S, partial [Leuconostoc sp.]|nr:restriction endonuclease subunit S [Leuconostoc sp.]
MNKVKLKDIADIQAGPFGTQLHKSEYVESGIFMINAKNIGNGIIIEEAADYVPDSVVDRLPRYLIKEGDILFGRAGSIERHTYVEKEFDGTFQGTNCIRIRCHDRTIAKYVSYYLWLKNVKASIENNTGGSVQAYISSDLLKDITIVLPDEGNIKKITSILDKLDQKIKNNNAINDNLAKQLNVLYQYWFMQFQFPDKDGKPYLSNQGEMQYNSRLKKNIPIRWKVQSIAKNDLSSIIKPGVEHFTSKTYYPTSEVNGTTIGNGAMFDFETRESRANMQPTEYSVWFAKMKNSVKHLFLNPELKPIIDSSILSTGFSGLQCDEKSFEYISSVISSEYFETIKDTLAHGATQEAVNNDDLANIFFVIPDNTTLEKYHVVAEKLFSQISNNIIESKELTNL